MVKIFFNIMMVILFCTNISYANNIDYNNEDAVSMILPDPLEPLNRAIYGFNKNLDYVIIKPVAHIYITIVPKWGQDRVASVLSNFYEPINAVNNLLQHNADGFGNSIGRFIINSTFGILGLFDIASLANIREYKSNFAETLRHYCVGSGPYVVIPLIGPASKRAAVGRVVDFFTNPLHFMLPDDVLYAKFGVEVVHNRANLLNATKTLSSVALDEYAFVRSVYSQKYYEAINGSHSHCNEEK
jgi:phospholipid-binding lipoprotein MlaA